ncbi:MAG: hypothetical protein ABL898_03825 [Hyphomicrobiaceae bacterium]|nr:hypothetical protein [Hyphomicrobiaceae bacterium]
MASMLQSTSAAAVLKDVDATNDPRGALRRVRELRVAAEERGETVPELISKLERELTEDCIAESQGR